MPQSLRELMARYPYGQRITGWDPENPPEVERAFRVGYLIGASRCAERSLEFAEAFERRFHKLRGEIYWGEANVGFDRWSDRRAALLRGATQGAVEMVRARVVGVKKGIGSWIEELRDWAKEDPVRLAWSSAKPPDPPEADSDPLRRHEVPKHFWGDVFGMWAGMVPLGQLPGEPKPTSPQPPVMMLTPTNNHPLAPKPVTVLLSEVEPEPVRWLWPGRIALGKLTLLCGDPGLGKSFVTLDLAARVSSGKCWPDLPLLPNPPGGVVLLSAEDDLADTIRPRLDAAGANPSRVTAIQAVRRTLLTGQTREDYFDLTEDLPALETAIGVTLDCRLVVIDPLTAYLGKTDSHKNAEVRAVLAKLFELAARRNVAVLAVTHLNKAGGLPAIYRTMGSLAFVAAARAVWAVVRDENDETGRRRLFVPVKNNLGADESGLAYSLESTGDVARVAWESTPVEMRADDALGGGQGAAARDDAKRFVVETLQAHGISERTFRRARKAVAEVYKEKGKGGQWRCRLKGGQPCTP
jgi:hypothetical protein